MQKKMLQVLLVVAICITTFIAFTAVVLADDVSDFTYSLDSNGQATITGYRGQGSAVIIPDTILGYSVVGIGYDAFDNCNCITSLAIPDSVVSIGGYAFYNCNRLESFTAGKTNPAFSSQDGVLYNKDKTTLLYYPLCKKGDFTIPEGVKIIASASFSYCVGLTHVSIPNSVLSIENSAFMNCTQLQSVNLPDGITTIVYNTFAYCVNLQNISIPISVKSIEAGAFSDCDQLTDVFISKYVESLDNSSFSFCDSLVSITVDSDNQKYSSQDGVLYNHEKSDLLAFPAGKGGSFFMPDSVTAISKGGFYECNKLTYVKLSDNLNEISNESFTLCRNLKTIDVPISVARIGEKAVSQCYLLKQVVFPGPPPILEMNSFDSTTVLYYDIKYTYSWDQLPINCQKQAYCLVTINLLDGSSPSQIEDIIDSNYISEPAIPTRQYYSFGGWYRNADCMTAWDFSIDKVYSDITVYAKWIPNTYTISFNFQNASDTSTVIPVTADYNSTIQQPASPDRVGYTLTGWFTDQKCQNKWDFTTDVVAGNITLYAQWTAESISVTLDYQDDTRQPSVISVTFDSLYGLTKPSRIGYDFDGWFSDLNDPGTEIQANTKVTITSSQTFYAKWTPKSYNVTLNFQDKVTPSSIITVTYGSLYGDQLISPMRVGYDFNGWFTKMDGTGTLITAESIDISANSQTLYASWTSKTYYATLNFQDETTDPLCIVVTYGLSYGEQLISPLRAGYSFNGWFTGMDGTGIEIATGSIVSITSPQMLYAKWVPKSYNITLDFQDKTTPSSSIKVTYGSSYGEQLISPLRVGYDFNGWFTSKGGIGTQIVAGSTVTITGSQTLYASWTPKTYNTTLNFQDEATTPLTIVVTYGSSYGEQLVSPLRIGYDFSGWFTGKGGTGIEITTGSIVSIISPQMLYATWTPKSYDVTLDFQDNVTPSSDITVTYGSSYGKLLITPLRTGYVFAGWFTGKDGAGTKITAESIVTNTSTLKLFANWTAKIYAVAFDYQDGKTRPTVVSVTFDSTYGSLPSPNRAGYRFGGWFTGRNGSGTRIMATTKVSIANNHTLYAKWTADPVPSSVNAVSHSYSSILVSWAAVPNAKGYEVCCATARAGLYTSVGTPTGTSLLVTHFITGKIYYFKVRAFTLSGSTRIYSSFSSVVPAWPQPATPTSLKASRASSTNIKLTWGKVAGATKYEIWRRSSSGGDFRLFNSTASNSFTNTKLTSGVTYYYEVRAYCQVKKVKVYGDFSAVASAKP